MAKAEENLKIRTDELLQSKKDLRVKDEEIQQREIEISCLRGQVSNNGSVSVCIVVITYKDFFTEEIWVELKFSNLIFPISRQNFLIY